MDEKEKKNETLSFNEYQKEAYDLISEEGKKNRVLNGVLGLSGESGECADIVKKNLFQGHPFPKEHRMFFGMSQRPPADLALLSKMSLNTI